MKQKQENDPFDNVTEQRIARKKQKTDCTTQAEIRDCK